MPRFEKTKHFIRERKTAKHFAAGSFRTKKIAGGRRLVFACPFGFYNEKTRKCKTSMSIHSILRPLKKNPYQFEDMWSVLQALTQVVEDSISRAETVEEVRHISEHYDKLATKLIERMDKM